MKLRARLGILATCCAVGCSGAPKDAKPAAAQAPPGETLTSEDFSMVLPLGLQAGAAYLPEKNPLTQAKIELGHKLYFDGRLSRDGTISCATCHAADLEDQTLGTIQNPVEMGHTLDGMIAGVQAIQGYAPEFEKAFGSPGIN